MEKCTTNILLELTDDIIIEYPNAKEYIQQKLQEKCKEEGILIDTVFFNFFLNKFFLNNIFTNQAYTTYSL